VKKKKAGVNQKKGPNRSESDGPLTGRRKQKNQEKKKEGRRREMPGEVGGLV